VILTERGREKAGWAVVRALNQRPSAGATLAAAALGLVLLSGTSRSISASTTRKTCLPRAAKLGLEAAGALGLAQARHPLGRGGEGDPGVDPVAEAVTTTPSAFESVRIETPSSRCRVVACPM
jgi:hypothetical protein